MSGAVEKVFCTPELLELILLSLKSESQHRRTLFHIQRVNRTFQATIAGSLELQRKLLFAQNLRPAVSRGDTDPSLGEYLGNPLGNPNSTTSPGDLLRMVYCYTTSESRSQCIRFCSKLVLNLGSERGIKAETVLAGSWRRMYAATSSYQVEHATLAWEDHSVTLRREKSSVDQHQNMTMGQMFDWVMESAASDARNRIRAHIRGVGVPDISSLTI